MEANFNYIAIIAGFAVVSAVYTAVDYLLYKNPKQKEKVDTDSNVLIMCMTENDYKEFRRGNVWISALDDV